MAHARPRAGHCRRSLCRAGPAAPCCQACPAPCMRVSWDLGHVVPCMHRLKTHILQDAGGSRILQNVHRTVILGTSKS